MLLGLSHRRALLVAAAVAAAAALLWVLLGAGGALGAAGVSRLSRPDHGVRAPVTPPTIVPPTCSSLTAGSAGTSEPGTTAASPPDPLESRVQAVCGALYGTREFRVATGAADAGGGDGGGGVRTVTQVPSGGGIADHAVGSTSILLAAVFTGRRAFFDLPYLSARAATGATPPYDAADCSLPVWAPRFETRPSGTGCDAAPRPGVQCPFLDWVEKGGAIYRALSARNPPTDPFLGAQHARVRLSRGMTVALHQVTNSYARRWLAEVARLNATTTFGCLFHAIYRVNPALVALPVHRPLLALLADPVHAVIGVHIRSGDDSMRTPLESYAPAARARHLRLLRAAIGCARIAHATLARASPATVPDRLVILVASDSLAVRQAVAASVDEGDVAVRLISDMVPEHVSFKPYYHYADGQPSENAMHAVAVEHWALARTRALVKVGRSGFGTSAVFAGFHERVWAVNETRLALGTPVPAGAAGAAAAADSHDAVDVDGAVSDQARSACYESASADFVLAEHWSGI